MEKKLELSAEHREMTIGFVNNILPLAFGDVAQAVESKERTLIQKRFMGTDASMGMMTLLVEDDQSFILDFFVSSNRIHGMSVHVQVVKNGVLIESTIRNNRIVEELVAPWMELEHETIPSLVELMSYFEEVQPTVHQQQADSVAVENLLVQMQEERKRELIDHYLETGEFEKIVALQNGAGADGHLYV